MGWPHRKQSSARERKQRNLTSKRNGARSGRSGHASRRTFFFDFLAFSLLALNFPFRRHKACPLHTNIAGQMGSEQTLYFCPNPNHRLSNF